MKTALLKSRNVIGATCVHIAASRYRDIFQDSYDCLIMDEAGTATPAETLIPAVRAKHVVLIGDHKQLPPFVTAEREVWKKVQDEDESLEDDGLEDLRRKFGESMFEKLIEGFSEPPGVHGVHVMLNTQRRMPKQLGDLISKHFYEGELKTPDDEKFCVGHSVNLPFKQPTSLLFINTSKRKDHYDNNKSNWRQNQCNVTVVEETLCCLDKRLICKHDFAIIAAYRGQVDLLHKRVRSLKSSFKWLQVEGENPVNTVDGFQGRENDIVIFDTVRSSQGGTVGFLDEARRLNVALSRARKLLIIIGDVEFLCQRATPGSDRNGAEKPILGEIADDLTTQGLVFNAMQDAFK